MVFLWMTTVKTPLWFLAQAGGGEPWSGLTNYGFVGTILAVTFAFVWYVINGYRKDNAELRSENRESNTYLREHVVPLVANCSSALKETSASNAEVAKALAQVVFLLSQRDGTNRG